MKSDPAQPADHAQLLRQQLILAQVRIMELEDQRDTLTPRVNALETLVTEAQTLADAKADEAAHLTRVQQDLQAQLEHQRHLRHVTHLALEEARQKLAGTEAELSTERAQAADLRAKLATTLAHRDSVQTELRSLHAEANRRADRIAELDRERAAMRASRSWRWTAWLRSLERWLNRSSP